MDFEDCCDFADFQDFNECKQFNNFNDYKGFIIFFMIFMNLGMLEMLCIFLYSRRCNDFCNFSNGLGFDDFRDCRCFAYF